MENIKTMDVPDILLIDDTPEDIEAAVALFRENGYRVRIATQASTALKLLEQQAPDIILLDIYMPEMDGFQLCQTIKGQLQFASLPIIFLTSSNDEESIKRGFELGAQDYVVKPFNLSELLARVDTHVKLKHQSESLIEAYEELDSFCYTVAHDLKAPLLSIGKLLEYLALDYSAHLDEDGLELLSHIQDKSHEVLSIIDHLLEFSRMCEMPLTSAAINLETLFLQVFNELKEQQGPRQIELILGRLPEIHGDPFLIKLLLTNVLSNAIKYTGGRDIAVIEASSREQGNEYLVSIKDNGIGFDMRYASRLFKVFQRLHSQEEFPGSGVGLAICQRILKRHGGRAWLIGDPDNGATFYFTYPRSQRDQDAPLHSVSPGAGILP